MSIENLDPILKAGSPVNNSTLTLIALTPTLHLPRIAEADFVSKLTDEDFMRIAVLLAQKGYEEGGCPIGGLIIDNESRLIIGKGHNRHIQESRVYWHGETDAINDAGQFTDFSLTTLFTTLTPCSVCTALTHSQSFNRLVIGNRLEGVNEENENILRNKGVQVDILEDEEGKALYAKYAAENPEQDTRDWQGQAGVERRRLQMQCCPGH